MKSLTPAQDYAMRMIAALEGFIENPEDVDSQNDILMFILERPKTLRSALSMYLHKSQSAQLVRESYKRVKEYQWLHPC